MRGRIICTSLKMRKRMAGRLRDEGKHLKALFKELVSHFSGYIGYSIYIRGVEFSRDVSLPI